MFPTKSPQHAGPAVQKVASDFGPCPVRVPVGNGGDNAPMLERDDLPPFAKREDAALARYLAPAEDVRSEPSQRIAKLWAVGTGG
jgi:hypothetical protein